MDIDGRICTCLIDTGSEVIVMAHDAAKGLAATSELRTVNNASTPDLDEVDLRARLGDKRITLTDVCDDVNEVN